MHFRIPCWLAGTLAIAAIFGAASIGQAQQLGSDPSYLSTSDGSSGSAQIINTSAAVPAGDLSARVAVLEKALADAKAKADADKKAASGKPTVNLGGKLQLDTAAFSQNAASVTAFGNAQNGFEARRVRLKAYGTGFDVVEYAVEADFADKTFAPTVTTAAGGGAVALGSPGVKMKDVYIGVTELPVVGNVRIGHFKEPFGLEQLTGDNFYTFMEASTADDGAFVPVRDTGVMLWNWTENQRATWAFGVFKGAGVESTDGNSTNANFEAPLSIKSDDGLSLTERFTWLPWYDECTEGRGLLHTGISYSYRDPGNGSGTGEIVQFTQTSEAHLGPSIINMVFNGSPSATAANNAANALQHEDLVGGELAWVYGPFSVQSEYMGGYFNYFAGKGHNLAGTGGKGYGGYIFASYFLTGENRAYDRHHGVFTRVKPFENFFRVRGEDGCVYTGMGAWEIGYRLSYINLDNANGIDQTATAGLAATRAVDHTVGLNWYLNPYTKMMLNYVHTDDSVGAAYAVAAASSRGSIDTIEMRAQIDF